MALVLLLSTLLLVPMTTAWNTHKNSLALRRYTALFAKEVTVTNLDNGVSIQIEAGAPLSLAATRSGMRLSFQCKAGTCKSCTTILDGQQVDTCRTKVPDKAKVTLKKKTRLS
jgi:ferredoxin